ncbi:MAG: dipeptidase [Bacteroidota bacterium]
MNALLLKKLLFLFLPLLCTLEFLQGDDHKILHTKALVVDTHNDVAQRIMNGEDISKRTDHGQSDLPRFKEGGLDVEVFSIWVPPEKTKPSYFEQANDQIDSIEYLAKRNSGTMGMARTANEVEKMAGDGKFVAMLGLEGGHPIENNLKKLENFYRRGVRYMTLTWNNSADWATSAKDETDPKFRRHKGLTDFGKQVIKKMNDMGMMVDVSHVGEQTFWDVIHTSRKPIIASHSSAWALCHNRRNLKDDQLKAIADNGGVVFINFAPWFIDSTFAGKESKMKAKNAARIDSFIKANKFPDAFTQDQRVAEFLADQYLSIRPPLSKLIDHFDYVAKLIGADHVGIGSDFDGISVTPLDMDDVTHLPLITSELLKRGYSADDVKKILGENFLRVLRENEKK